MLPTKSILRQATKLRVSSTWKKVYISPDLTLKEREQGKKLREELKKRKEAGEKDIYIKSGKMHQKVSTTDYLTAPAFFCLCMEHS